MSKSFLKFAFTAIMPILLLITVNSDPAAASPNSWLEQCRPYETKVKQILASENIDQDYYYLMVAESHCTPKARSQHGAQGFWQLIPRTSHHYGCFYPDDLECSTRAAARYIKRLQEEFKDFDAVIAAYNMGGHNLKQHGINKSAQALIWTVKRLKRTARRLQNEALAQQ
ncbi:MAG: transglycosylase SLT domain-containing protein [Proteobacteria bacterium]|nr:transglycosylase SLT domain-containing protein [Pseudomonadota bacterium]